MRITCYLLNIDNLFHKLNRRCVKMHVYHISLYCSLRQYNGYHINVKLIRYQFWCTRCAFRLIKSLQWCSSRKSWKSKKCKNCERADKNQKEYHEIEPNNIIYLLRILNDYIKLTFYERYRDRTMIHHGLSRNWTGSGNQCHVGNRLNS
jgi:hypothetical protein